MFDDEKKSGVISPTQHDVADTTLSNDDGSAFDILDKNANDNLINDNVIDDIDTISNNSNATLEDTNQMNDECNTDTIGDNFDDDDDIIYEQSTASTKKKKHKIPTQKLVLFAIFLAVTILFQYVSGYIKIGAASICIVLIPIVLGGVILGVWAGTLLGFAFGLITLIGAIMGGGLATVLLTSSPALCVLTLLCKGTLCGLIPALLYKVIAKKNRLVGCIVASIFAPIVNTGIFILGGLTMSNTIESVLATSQETQGMSVIYYLVIVVAGINFLIELAVNIVASPAIFALNNIYQKRYAR